MQIKTSLPPQHYKHFLTANLKFLHFAQREGLHGLISISSSAMDLGWDQDSRLF